MRCPVCKEDRLEAGELLNDLKVHSCYICHGNWVRYDNYDHWKRHQKEDEPAVPSEDYMPAYDSKQANLCPDCGRILIKYRVSKDIDFNVDHCGYCNGVWLDKNEWEILTDNNLHRQLYNFFTRPWQKKLREDISKQHLEKQYINRFGPDSYERLKDIREWIESSGKKSEMLAFLLDDEPYKI